MATRISHGGDDSRMVSFLDIERMLIQSVGEISGVDMDGREYKGIEDLWSVELSNGPSASVRRHDSDQKSDKLTLSRVNPDEKQILVDSPPQSDADVGKKWYNTAYDFWEDEKNCPISDDGVLGGYGRITTEDVKGSNQFLDELSAIRPTLRFDCAADCGAGIGRVAKHLLLHRFDHVDIIEQSPRLLAAAPKYIGEMSSRATCVVQRLQVTHFVDT
jgi:protein N-terminal methyltransferase